MNWHEMAHKKRSYNHSTLTTLLFRCDILLILVLRLYALKWATFISTSRIGQALQSTISSVNALNGATFISTMDRIYVREAETERVNALNGATFIST